MDFNVNLSDVRIPLDVRVEFSNLALKLADALLARTTLMRVILNERANGTPFAKTDAKTEIAWEQADNAYTDLTEEIEGMAKDIAIEYLS